MVLYKTEPLAERVLALTGGYGVDRVIEVDLGVNAEADLALLRPGGQCIAYGSSVTPLQLPFFTLLARNINLHFFAAYVLAPADRQRAIASLTRMLERGALQHNVAERVPLAEIARAHEVVEGGKAVGNVVLRVGPEHRSA